jgi:hypothetical protein
MHNGNAVRMIGSNENIRWTDNVMVKRKMTKKKQ